MMEGQYMMIMTAKVDLKKIVTIISIIVLMLVAAIWLLDGNGDATAQTSALPAGSNDQRVKFLTDFGWDVNSTPVETSQVRIPEESSEAFDRYCLLQKSNGFDLKPYAGKKVMRYVYQINNYPGATEPVYATVLVYKNQIIGGDITDTAAKGQIRGFKMPEGTKQTTPTESTGNT